MIFEVKWCGIDFGQCLMDPSGLRNYLVIGDICKELGEPEAIWPRIHKFRVLKEKYGAYASVKEGHRDEILSYVFDNNSHAIELLTIKEQEHLLLAPGAEELLVHLREQGIHTYLVSEMKKTLGPIDATGGIRFLKNKNLTQYFEELVSPQGKFNLKNGSVDTRYKGKTKQEGTLYDLLVEDLLALGIKPSEGVMIGDKIATDIVPAKQKGFKTIQYTGYFDYGASEADFAVSNFLELIQVIKGVTS